MITKRIISLNVAHHRVRYMDPSFLGGSQKTVSSSEEQLFIGSLHPGVDYSFTVTAFNDIGFGSESESLLVTTLDECMNN